jgi:hypothetical protein
MAVTWPSIRFVLLALVISGCTRTCGENRASMPPEKVVESYLNTALNMRKVTERDVLLQFTSGRLKEAISSATDETIETAYIKRHYNLESYAVIERRDRTPRETEITFRLRYKDLGSGDAKPADGVAPTVQTENTVGLIREKGTWYIRDVIGAKTSIDFPVSAESQITAKAGVVSPDPAPAED